MKHQDTIHSINGPVITVKNTASFQMLEMVHVGDAGLIAEVISINDKYTTIQVYEDTAGLVVGEKVVGSGAPLSVTLGPGILDNIFDGIERPLRSMEELSGAFISKGLHVASLDEEKLWDVSVLVKQGDVISGGAIIASCPETPVITHKSLLDPRLSGRVIWAAEDGKYNICQPIVKIEDEAGEIHEVCLAHKWPVKQSRPYIEREPISKPLITGQRVIDTLFPIAKGGAAAIPGGFGAGKTITQHQIAKWSDADIVIYVGCGERGNEMTQVLEEFSELLDPKTNRPMTDRTALIANTSNMPVAAREASIYTGVTLAEYYRDMGYDVAIMADSTSRWAEALREISGRLEEMPAEEGFPAYLPSRIAGFYERAGLTLNLNKTVGSVTIIGAVSPQGADFSEPVTQNTKRFVRCFLALDKNLSYARHFPAINWNMSYSEYYEDLDPYYENNVDGDFPKLRARLMVLLNEETSLQEIVKLIGTDVLPENQKLVLEVAKVVRTGFLQQNAYNKLDAYVTLAKQQEMMKLIMYLYDKTGKLVDEGVQVKDIAATGIFDDIVKIKYEISNERLDMFDDYYNEIDKIAMVVPRPTIGTN